MNSRMDLYDSYINLSNSLVNKFHKEHSWLDKDDLDSIARIALWKATETFDPTIGAKFATWASVKIYNALREYNRSKDILGILPRSRKESDPICLLYSEYECDYNYTTEELVDYIHCTEDCDRDLSSLLDIIFKFSPSNFREFNMLMDVFVYGYQYCELESKYGISASGIHEALKRYRTRLANNPQLKEWNLACKV